MIILLFPAVIWYMHQERVGAQFFLTACFAIFLILFLPSKFCLSPTSCYLVSGLFLLRTQVIPQEVDMQMKIVKFQMSASSLSKRGLTSQLSGHSNSIPAANIYELFTIHHFMSTRGRRVNITEKFPTPLYYTCECQELGNK